MEPSEYLDSVRANTALLIEAVRQSSPDASVPTCPDWKVADLARHQGRVFRWMSIMLETKAQEFLSPREFEEQSKRADDPLAWLEASAEQALAVFAGTDPDTPVWNWLEGGPAPARFWFRRLAHETVIHRVDAEGAAGRAPATRVEPAELASDGIDEFLHLIPARAGRDGPYPLSGSYHFHTTDVTGEWVVVFDSDGVTVRREHAKADVAVRGPASDLELFLYNRRGSEGLETFGDPAAIAAWGKHIRF